MGGGATQTADGPPPARGVACADSGHRLVTFGGYSGSYSRLLSTFDAETLTWSRLMPSGRAPKPRQGATLTSLSSYLILYGGSDDVTPFGDVHLLRDVSADSPAAPSWQAPPVHCEPRGDCHEPPPREQHTATVVDRKVWVFGGLGGRGRERHALDDLHYLRLSYRRRVRGTDADAGADDGDDGTDVPRLTWHAAADLVQTPQFAPRARFGHTAIGLGERLYIFGGYASRAASLSDLHIFDTTHFTWSQPQPARAFTPEPRAGAAWAVSGRDAYLVGGCSVRADTSAVARHERCYDDVLVLKSKYVRRHSAAGSLVPTTSLAGPPLGDRCHANCSSHGDCWQGRCLCAPGYEGYDCADSVQCQPADCSRNGICSAGRCFCDPGYDGDACEYQLACPANCSARGTCRYGRCVCAAGWTGADCATAVACPNGCSDRGICLGAKCFCSHGYSGDDCSTALPCPSDCSGRGLCHNGRCFCDPGYDGDDCDTKLPCPAGCSGRGRCIHGTCWCDVGHGGDNCSEPDACPNDCNLVGVCVHGRCECEPGFAGEDCSTPLFECLRNCSGHGACRYGACMCEPGWAGEDCARSVGCPKDCSGAGVCYDGICLCVEGHGGADCSSVAPCPHGCVGKPGAEVAAAENAGAVFAAEPTACPGGCSGRGVCVDGACECELAFAGVDCSVARECPSDCNGRGTCLYGKCYCQPGASGEDCAGTVGCEAEPDAAARCGGRGACAYGRCFCDPGWYGHNCSLPVPCPNMCGGGDRGTCANGRCYCYAGWGGPDCTSEAACPADRHGDACSARGECVRGQCVCEPGYTGDACEAPRTCPAHDCRNQGRCWGGQCLCHPGFEGPDCSFIASCEEDCSSHGTCRNGQCFCDPGFTGDACEVVLGCDNGCSSHGVCQHGRCFCDAGWRGGNCAERATCPVADGRECAGRGLCVNGMCVCTAGAGGSDCREGYDARVDRMLHGERTVEEQTSYGRSLHGRRLLWHADVDAAALGPAGLGGAGPALGTLRSASAAELVAGAAPSHVWPAARAEWRPAGAAAARPTTRASGAAPLAAIAAIAAAPAPPAACLNMCSQHGVCNRGRCFCDPGWAGDDCAHEARCLEGCQGHGKCANGLCYCEPGWTGVDCGEVVPCLNQCSHRGECIQAKCFCDHGWEGPDCSAQAPPEEHTGVPIWAVAMMQPIIVFIGVGVGWGAKHLMDVQQRRKMREILQHEAQRPFVSGPPISS